MKKSRFSETEIVSILKRADAGLPVKALCVTWLRSRHGPCAGPVNARNGNYRDRPRFITS